MYYYQSHWITEEKPMLKIACLAAYKLYEMRWSCGVGYSTDCFWVCRRDRTAKAVVRRLTVIRPDCGASIERQEKSTTIKSSGIIPLVASAIRFYALQGNSFVQQISNSKSQTFIECLRAIRSANRQAKACVVLWDNLPSHCKREVEQAARQLQIILVNLPAYAPDLNGTGLPAY